MQRSKLVVGLPFLSYGISLRRLTPLINARLYHLYLTVLESSVTDGDVVQVVPLGNCYPTRMRKRGDYKSSTCESWTADIGL
jgi:hypothetical protein